MKINPININDFGDIGLNEFKITKNAVKDIDGNYYDSININGKDWFTSNLMTIRLNDGTPIPSFEKSHNGSDIYHKWPVDRSIFPNYKKYGLFYNFAVIDTKIIAPKGWHVPSLEEWYDMFSYVAGFNKYNLTSDEEDIHISHIAKSLCSTSDWHKTKLNNAVGDDQTTNNKTGFNIFPAGYFNYFTNTLSPIGLYSYFWCNEELQNFRQSGIGLTYNSPCIRTNIYNAKYGFSIRCVKD